MNCSWPLTVSASGRKYVKENYGDIFDIQNVVYEYPSFIMTYTATWTNAHGMGGGRTPGMNYYGMGGPFNRPHAEAFYGTKGTLITDRISYEVYPEIAPGTGDGEPDAEQPRASRRRKLSSAANENRCRGGPDRSPRFRLHQLHS